MPNKAPNTFFSLKTFALLVCSWSAGFCMLLYLCRSTNISPESAYDLFASEPQSLPPNESGVFSLVSYHPDKPGRPEYSIRFEHLKVENGQLGLFHTALYQQLSIKDVSLCIFSYETSPKCRPQSNIKHSTASPKLLTENVKGPDPNPETFLFKIDDIINRLPGIIGRPRDAAETLTVSLPNLFHALHVDVDRFYCAWLLEDRPQLTIESRRARFDAAGDKQIVLRGLVKINTPEQTLSGNHIVWDIDAQHFYVKGSCLYTAGGQSSCHRNLVLDTDLNIIGAPPLEKGDALCHAAKAY